MSIRIFDEPEIVIGRAEHDRLLAIYIEQTRDWLGTLPPPSFEQWLRINGYGDTE